MGKLLRGVAYLVAGALLATQVTLAVASVYFRHNDLQMMVLVGDSMAPAYRIGDAVLLDVGDRDIAVDDVITFRATDGRVTTHRVIAKRHVRGALHFQTQGDANAGPDPDLVSADAVFGVPVRHFPDAGRAVVFLNSHEGRLLTYGPALLLLAVVELANVVRVLREDTPGKDDSNDRTDSMSEVAVPPTATNDDA